MLAWLLLLGCGAPEPPPNVILAIGDDQDYRDFGFMGSEVALTPRLDALAAEGFVFRSGYSTASSCRPALRTLLTGLHPNQYEVRVEHIERAYGAGATDAVRRLETLPRVLARRGYATFQAGRHWEGTFADAGFAEGTKDVRDGVKSPPGHQILRDGLEPVLEFIDRNRDRPFFLWYAPQVPHIPHDPPAQYSALYADGRVPQDLVPYYGSVSWFDAGMGRIVDHLERAGLRERTLIVYLVDNGWQPLSRESTEVPRDRNIATLGGPAGKFSLYDPGFRTPILFDWPGRIAPGRADGLVSIADVYPTILGFAGAAALPDREGADLRPVLLEGAPPRAEVVIGQMAMLRSDDRAGARRHRRNLTKGGNFYRDDTWHYLAVVGRAPELYRIADDPDETRDLAAQRPDLVARFEREIAHWRARTEGPPAAESPER